MNKALISNDTYRPTPLIPDSEPVTIFFLIEPVNYFITDNIENKDFPYPAKHNH